MSWAEIYPWEPPAPPVVRGVYGQVRAAILQGALAPGVRLPSSRDLAARLGVARASVVTAYEQLLAEGYAVGRPGSGTYVRADLSGVLDAPRGPTLVTAPPPGLPDKALAFGATPSPPPRPGARTFNTGRTLMDARAQAAWGRSARRAIRALSPEDFGYADPAGDAALRGAIVDYLRAARGVRCEPDQVIVTTGAQHAQDIIARVLLSAGDAVWVEDPGYPATLRILESAGTRLIPVPVDDEGLNVAEGVRVAADARAAFVTPSHQYPLGVALSMARRLELLAWAREAGAWVVEDDYASEFRYAGPPLTALQGLDGGQRVIYIGTLNKALFPGLRLGYLVAPRALIGPLTQARRMIDRQAPTLTQAMVLDFMAEGEFAAHIRRRRVAYGEQRDALAQALEAQLGHVLEVASPDQGLHLIAYLKHGRCDLEAEALADAQGVTVQAISRLYRGRAPRSGLLLGFSGYPVRAMAPGVARLAKALG
ncbi:PLP-dependent aminotransferase family protein [Phenylobacterium aquaticum]|uniref:MocR-like pyridoxine biosynthesis transcription factor PdxR n=1 Tax=Phenylobacterium aquaticum TaxID=1763816 RepID=UPI0026EA5FE8|nr:PLP-dependent aminotransferase family protein [Phenylobacterium aquaticum]